MSTVSLPGFVHCTPIQIRFKDIDRLGHVNNANHLTYFEIARTEYFREVFAERIDWHEEGTILARTEIDYRTPIFLRDELYCFTKVSRMGSKSFDMLNVLVRIENGQVVRCAEGRCVMVCMNYNTNETIAMPASWREAVAAYEKD